MIIKIYLFIVNHKQFRIENEVTLLSSFALISKNPFTNLQIQQFLILINSNFLERDQLPPYCIWSIRDILCFVQKKNKVSKRQIPLIDPPRYIYIRI